MRFGILAIGNEILEGIVEDRNSRKISDFFSLFDLTFYEKMEVRDDVDLIAKSLEFFSGFVDIVVTTGGLGPTDDDLTREGVAKFLQVELEFKEEIWEDILSKLSIRKVTPKESHKKMAFVPKGALPIRNPLGLAWGFVVKGNPIVISLPGVSRELEAMLEEIPRMLNLTKKNTRLKTFKIIGLRESEVNEITRDLLNPLDVKWGTLIREPEIWIRVHGDSKMVEFAEMLLEKAFGINLYGKDNDSLELLVGKILADNNLTISTCESCTGGLIASMITDVPGSSVYFKGSIVAYHESAKTSILGIEHSLIDRYTVYSREVAQKMATNVRKIFGTDIGISTTGIAGPTGGNENNPVGRVYIGFSMEDEVDVVVYNFHYDRIKNKVSFAKTALDVVRRKLIAKGLYRR